MALVSAINVGDKIGYFGQFRTVLAKSAEGQSFLLTVQEDGRTAQVTEHGKTNYAVEGE